MAMDLEITPMDMKETPVQMKEDNHSLTGWVVETRMVMVGLTHHKTGLHLHGEKPMRSQPIDCNGKIPMKMDS